MELATHSWNSRSVVFGFGSIEQNERNTTTGGSLIQGLLLTGSGSKQFFFRKRQAITATARDKKLGIVRQKVQ